MKDIIFNNDIVFVLLVLWVIGSFFALEQRYVLGLPLLGMFVYGIKAAVVVLVLDILAPTILLYSIWNRLYLGVQIAYFYMGFFILNSIVAFFTVREVFGTNAILIPPIVTGIFLYIIHRNKNYFYS